MQEFEINITKDGIRNQKDMLQYLNNFFVDSKKYTIKFIPIEEEFVKDNYDVVIYGEYGLVGNTLSPYFKYSNIVIEGNENINNYYKLRICVISIIS